MNMMLKQLSPDGGQDVYAMLQELPKDENGFINGCQGKSYAEFKDWLIKSDNVSKGIGLADWMVPQTIYWLCVDNKPVGMGKLRHFLTEKLLEEGGHGGYAIRPSCRNKGYGTALLTLMIREAAKLGIDRLLLTVQNHNLPSIKVALANGGVIERVNEQRHYVWIDCSQHKSEPAGNH